MSLAKGRILTVTIRRALLSVSSKEGLVDFARALRGRDVSLLSTGGTAALLRAEGIEVTDVSAVTGFPEIMDGRVKTLHPAVHGALLGRRGIDEAVMQQHGIEPIDLVAVNLYPFSATIASPVPGPILGAGLPGVVMTLGGLLAWRRRRQVIA